ncbi:MAG: hypothetical protein C4548_14470 [Desulfobacteraceae bacterium]|nr:MAG: hypothetical protein C4548_14470 [Desulfobacteraceae bacterium]
MWKRTLMAVGILLWSTVAGADVTITKVEDGFKEMEHYKGGKMAMVSDDNVTIVDASAKTITIINPEAMVYAESTLDQYKKIMTDHFKSIHDMHLEMMMAATGQSRAEATAALKQLGGAADKPKAVKMEKGAAKDIAGYPSEQYRFLVDGELAREVWISSAVDALIAKEMGPGAKKALDAAFREMEAEFNAAVTVYSGQDNALEKAVADVMAKGYLMHEIGGHMQFDGDKEPVPITVSTGRIDPSVFKVPPGYEKVGMAEFLERQMMADEDDDYDDDDDDDDDD